MLFLNHILFVSLTLSSIYDGVNAVKSGDPCYLLWTRQHGTCMSRNSCYTLNGTSIITAECNPGYSINEEVELICCPNEDSDETTISERSMSSLFPLPPKCGRTMYDELLDDRIVGGDEARSGAWPWIVMIGTKFNAHIISWTCGGALISSRWVLTAAHCYYEAEGALNWTRIGATNIRKVTEQTVDMRIELFILNEKYINGKFIEDIALAKLEQDVAFTDYVRPICLPLKGDIKHSEYIDETPYIAGWGTTKYNGLPSDALMELQIELIDRETCKKIYKPKRAKIVDTQICAGSLTEEKDSCQGDSGGPLMLYNSKYNSYFLIGIVSFGYKCAVIGYPGVYTKVSKYIDWIEETVQKNQYT